MRLRRQMLSASTNHAEPVSSTSLFCILLANFLGDAYELNSAKFRKHRSEESNSQTFNVLQWRVRVSYEIFGRYARVDRRPLDPPPVVQLRLFQVSKAGTEEETETEVSDYEKIDTLGLLCTADLFPVADFHTASQSSSPPAKSSWLSQDHQLAPSSSDRGEQEDADSHAFTSKVTHALVGATFVQPALVEYQGKKCILFVFADLAVKIEGSFFLRYRTFDLFSKPQDSENLVIQSQCFGAVFRVYSTKEFPGLQASTELTKQLARWGVRLNTRESERRRRKRNEQRSSSPLYTGTRLRKRSTPSTGDERSRSE